MGLVISIGVKVLLWVAGGERWWFQFLINNRQGIKSKSMRTFYHDGLVFYDLPCNSCFSVVATSAALA